MAMDVRGKCALLTGASTGIGRELAKQLAARGTKLALAARTEEKLCSLREEINRAGGPEPVVLPADLSQPGTASTLAEQACDALGQVDLLINNAAVNMVGAQWMAGDGVIARDLFETNFWSALALTEALVPAMRERGQGMVVNVASLAAAATSPFQGHYSASKAALVSATEALRVELKRSGVNVFLVVPGPVDTPLLAEAALLPSLAPALRFTPQGTAQEMARRIVRGIERGTRQIIYPRGLAFTFMFPGFARWMQRTMIRANPGDERLLIRGGSAGDPQVQTVRDT